MNRETAEALALRALAHIAADDRALQGLMAQSGLSVEDLGNALGDAAMLAGILDFLLSDDGLAADFCHAENLEPHRLAAARRALPGGDTYEY